MSVYIFRAEYKRLASIYLPFCNAKNCEMRASSPDSMNCMVHGKNSKVCIYCKVTYNSARRDTCNSCYYHHVYKHKTSPIKRQGNSIGYYKEKNKELNKKISTLLAYLFQLQNHLKAQGVEEFL